VELAALQSPIGDSGVIEQQCSAGAQTPWVIIAKTNRLPKLTPDNSP
jgi:hypothetical protein